MRQTDGRADGQTDGDKSALVELRFAAKNFRFDFVVLTTLIGT